ncbi:helix-turn-helix domain-containing protein [Cohnella sp.]|uniref:helix-turn-helix domain-containing protein n=1 Tax=Cohnella sp. TaxID=1883426 RepID=UPI0035614912
MKNIKKDLFEAFLVRYGFHREEGREASSREGSRYALSGEKGKGYYWVYTYENLFAISVLNFVIYEDFHMEYPQPDYISVSCYDSVSGEELQPYKRLSCSRIKGHIGAGNVYRAIYHRNIPIRCTSIMLMPDYYRDYLQTRYPGEYEDPREAFLSVDGSADFPELMILLGQIKNCRLTGLSAKLFYESKVAEAVSLIVHKTKESRKARLPEQVSVQDLKHLSSVKEYMDEHFAADLQLGTLAKIACMSATKLKTTFKKAYECTVFEYLLSRRVSRAEQLLAGTDISIRQISRMVGYSKASNFSSAFRRQTGLLPNVYRKMTVRRFQGEDSRDAETHDPKVYLGKNICQ